MQSKNGHPLTIIRTQKRAVLWPTSSTKTKSTPFSDVPATPSTPRSIRHRQVRLNALQARLDLAENERERLIADGKAKDETIGKLNREIGKWQARYEILKEQLEEKDDES